MCWAARVDSGNPRDGGRGADGISRDIQGTTRPTAGAERGGVEATKTMEMVASRRSVTKMNQVIKLSKLEL